MSTTIHKDGFRLTGRHVLAITMAFFGLIFAANAALIWLALGSFPGTVTDSSYRASQTYNAEIAAAGAQAARGWKVDASLTRAADGHAAVAVEIHDHDGRALTGLAVEALLEHPATRALDRTLTLAETVGTTGRYAAAAEDLPAGQWRLVIRADGGDGRTFRSESRIVLR